MSETDINRKVAEIRQKRAEIKQAIMLENAAERHYNETQLAAIKLNREYADLKLGLVSLINGIE